MTADKELFKKAIIEALSEKYDQTLAICQENARCSKQHYIRMSEITGIALSGLISKRKSIKKALVALLIAAALLLAGCTAYVYRNDIRGFAEKFFDTYIKVSYSDEQMENDNCIDEYYTLSYVPEGYQLVSEMKNDLRAKYIWETTTGKRLMFEQMLIDGTVIIFDSEEGETQIITCGDITIYCRNYNGQYHYTWNDGKYIMLLYINEQLTEDQLNSILDGLTQ